MSRKNTRPLCPHCHKPINLKPKEYREIREMLRLTQREIAAKLGVKASHVAYLEAGRRMASPDLVARFLRLAGAGKKAQVQQARKVLRQAA